MPKIIILILFFLITSCGSRVATKQELLTTEDIKQKDCYAYSVNKEEMKKAVAWGVIGGLLGPFGILISLAGSAAQNATLPTKCGLTIDEVIQEAYMMAYYEDSLTAWTQKGVDSKFRIVADPIIRNGGCLLCKLQIIKFQDEGYKKYENYIELCKNTDGVPVITKDNCTKQEIESIKNQYEQTNEQKEDGRSP